MQRNPTELVSHGRQRQSVATLRPSRTTSKKTTSTNYIFEKTILFLINLFFIILNFLKLFRAGADALGAQKMAIRAILEVTEAAAKNIEIAVVTKYVSYFLIRLAQRFG